MKGKVVAYQIYTKTKKRKYGGVLPDEIRNRYIENKNPELYMNTVCRLCHLRFSRE